MPPGFAIATTAFTRLLEAAGLGGASTRRSPPSTPDDIDGAHGARERSARRCGAPVPDEVRDELAAATPSSRRGLGEPPVAVRSSALGEDSADATFAGQQETYLWVRGADELREAVRDCWASLHSARRCLPRAAGRRGAPAMGVTVQQMVDAEVSGVMFTCNPVSGDPSMVAVNASWGLGLAVVGGEVTPDEYLVSKVTGEVVRRTIGPKQSSTVRPPAGAGPSGGRARAAPAPPASTRSSWRELVDVGRRARAPLRRRTRTSSGRSSAARRALRPAGAARDRAARGVAARGRFGVSLRW